MIVNKERVKAFINETKEDAILASSLNHFSRYSFDTFCREHDLYRNGKVERSGGIVITCPFHEDSSPSFNFNDSLGVFNCFSCGGGDFWKFVYRYHTEVLGEKVGRIQLMNQYLQKDPDLMAKLHFNSLFSKYNHSVDELTSLKKYKFRRGESTPTNYLELQAMLQRKGMSKEQKISLILMMQSEVPVKMAYEELMKIKPKKQYSIEELEAF